MNRYLSSLAAMLMMCLLIQPANAATVVQSYRFVAVTEGPIASFTGATTLEIDADDTLSRVLDFDLTVGDQVFTAANVAIQTVFGGRAVILRSDIGGIVGPSQGHDGFLLVFLRDALPDGVFGYTLASEPDNQEGYGYKSVTIEQIADAVPEPATWAMMIVGFAAIGAVLRRRSLRVAVVSG